jgi:putative DNA methylase
MNMASAIEKNFPSKELGILAELESWRKEVNRPTYHMHKWWATRLGSVFRAILIGALSDAGRNIWEDFYRPVTFPGKVVFDPFMGSGTTIGEALKLGCKVIGSDINPVSAFQVRKALEAVRIDELQNAFALVESKVKQQIQDLYKSTDPESGLPSACQCFFDVI